MAYRAKIEIAPISILGQGTPTVRIEVVAPSALGALARAVSSAMGALSAEQAVFLRALRELRQAQVGVSKSSDPTSGEAP
jgi:hypothetical protein